MGIVHRDLKTQNILLDEFDDACVADFGLSAVMHGNQDLVGGVGTPHYTAPEVLQHLRYNEKIDVYSYGLVLWELLTQKVPYAGMKDIAIFDHVVNRNWRLPIPKEAPPGLRKIISRCWSRNPNDRPTFAEIVPLFEKHDVIFPQSQPVDFAKVNRTFRCPPLDFDCVFEVLKKPDHPRFSSLCDFIGRRIDPMTRERLRPWSHSRNSSRRPAKSTRFCCSPAF
jgi:serine/threonine protein kinase